MKRVGRVAIAAGAALSIVACAGPAAVEVEDASAIADAPVVPTSRSPAPVDDGPATTDPVTTDVDPAPTTSPGTTSPGTTSSETTSPGTTSPGTTAAERDPSLGVGDELFPELGSDDLDVDRYVVRLDASDPNGELIGSVEITSRVEPGVSAVALDTDGPEVSAVTVDGEDAPFESIDGELLVDTTADQTDDGRVVIVVDYRVIPDPDARSAVGLPVGWIATEDGAYVLNEPDGSSTWMPSNDHPSDKATWRFEIEVQAGHVASANGELVERPEIDDAGVWVWELDEPMPTYLVHLVIGAYDLIDGGTVTSSDGDEIPLTHLVPSASAGAFDDAIAGVADRIAFMEERFGPYPLERYGLAFVDGLSGLAMETQGRSLFGAADFAGQGTGFRQELLLSHELAHQWFGNAVSPAEWDDLWLNESITTYAQWLWLEEVGFASVDSVMADNLSRRNANSIDATGDPTVGNLFGFERYDGGAVVIHALRAVLGDDALFELLERWIRQFSGTSPATEDFIALAEEVHGADLGDFFDTWLFSVTLPATFPS